jgi:hypothetical protein
MKAHLITLALIATGVVLIVKFPLVFIGMITLAGLGVIYMVIHSAISDYL